MKKAPNERHVLQDMIMSASTVRLERGSNVYANLLIRKLKKRLPRCNERMSMILHEWLHAWSIRNQLPTDSSKASWMRHTVVTLKDRIAVCHYGVQNGVLIVAGFRSPKFVNHDEWLESTALELEKIRQQHANFHNRD